MFSKRTLGVCSLIVFFLALGLGEHSADSDLRSLRIRLLATNLIEARAQANSPGNYLNCSNHARSTCSVTGPSSVTVDQGTTKTILVELNCAAFQVHASWTLASGVNISASWNNLNASVTISASATASGEGRVYTEWCDEQNRHVVHHFSYTITTPSCGGSVCTSSQWCYTNPAGTASCVNFATAGQACTTPSTKCQPDLVCVNQICTVPRIPCQYNAVSPCAPILTGETSFVDDGRNNTFTVTLPAACGPASYTSFNASYTAGTEFYYGFPPSALQVIVNDRIQGSGEVTTEFCDHDSRYARSDVSWSFHN